jgi:AraC-like DNA-binding protein
MDISCREGCLAAYVEFLPVRPLLKVIDWSEEHLMILREFRASRAAHRLVRAYRVLHFDLTRVRTRAVKFVPPGPEVTLSFFLRGEKVAAEYPDGRRGIQADCGFTGVHDIATRCPVPPKDTLFLQIALQPGAVQRLTGISAEALYNRALDAADVLGQEVRRIHRRLQDARCYSEIVAIADTFMCGFADHRHPGRDFDVPLRLLRENPGISIDWLADQTSLSLRQFERCCLEHTGVTPKTFARLARFSRAFNVRLAHPERDWLSVAVDCGYFDYQHMARDFQHFMGQTPARAYAMQSTSPERLLGMTHEFHISHPDPQHIVEGRAAPARDYSWDHRCGRAILKSVQHK